jgi:O-antigen/teichoic acid export membrane protein
LFSKRIFQYAGFLKGNSRSDKTKTSIVFLFIIHTFNLGFTLLMVPVTLHCLNPTEYGLWLTLTSITTWFISLDFGLGNGLRNRLAEALARNDLPLAKNYVSTTYAYLGILVLVFYILFLISHFFLSWVKILNAPAELGGQISPLVMFVFSFFILNFILKIVTVVLLADQRPAVNGFLTLIINAITLAIIYVLSKTTFATLKNLGILVSAVPALVYVTASFFFFTRDYQAIKPSVKHVQPQYSRNLLQLGFRFFIIQISSLIVFATHNLIITQLFSPADVTVYNIAFKYFNIPLLVFGVILSPFWSAYTEAFVKQDFAWIKKVNQRLVQLWILFVGGVLIMLTGANFFYKIWVGTEIQIPSILSVLMAVFIVISMWNNIYAYFLNGVGKIQLQLYSAIAVGFLNIPLSILFAKHLNIGVAGVILATIICLTPSAIWSPLQYYKIVNQTARGIWNK